MNETAMAPSPTPDATRLTEPWRTTPAARMPAATCARDDSDAIKGPSAGERRRSPTCYGRRGMGDSHRSPPGGLVHINNDQGCQVRAHRQDLVRVRYGRTSTEAPRCQTPWLLSSADHLPSDSAVRRQRSDGVGPGTARGGRVVVHVSRPAVNHQNL